MTSTVHHLAEFDGGHRILDVPGVAAACEVLDELGASDLQTLWMSVYAERAAHATSDSIVNGTQFHAPSTVSPRDMHTVHGIIFDALSDTTFIEPSPLQPLGTNAFLAGTDQKNVIGALRGSEVNADITSALFRAAIAQWRTNMQVVPTVHLAGNGRITRSQTFAPETKFLPHFGMFGQVTIGRQEQAFGPEELDALASHLSSEVGILDHVAAHERSAVAAIDIKVGNLLFMADLAKRGLINVAEIRKHTIDPDYNAFTAAGLDMPTSLPLNAPNLGELLADLGFTKGRHVIEHFQELLYGRNETVLNRATLDLGRIAGIGYYKNLCYKIDVANQQGVKIPLVDGGGTDWAARCGYGKKAFTITSGIGTELLAKHFLLPTNVMASE